MFKFFERTLLTLLTISLATVSIARAQLMIKNSAQAEIMRLTTTGNVGIMTTNPTSRLAVNGGVSVGDFYSVVPAPTNGLIVEQSMSIGSMNLDGYDCLVSGTARINQLNIKGAYTFPTVAGTTSQFLNGLAQWADLPIDGDGIIGNEIKDATNTTLTRSTTQPYSIALNLGNLNTWTAVQTFSAGARFPSSGIWNTSGSVGVGIANPGSRLSVNGGATIGASYATLSAPTNGLLVQGLVGVNTTIPTPTAEAQVNVSWNANSTSSLDVVGDAYATSAHNTVAAVGVKGEINYPSVSSISINRSGVRGPLVGIVSGTKHVVVQGELGYYVGGSDPMIVGAYGKVNAVVASWGSVAVNARRASLMAMNFCTSEEDYGIYIKGPRHFIQGELLVRGEAFHTSNTGTWEIPSDGTLKDVGGTYDRGLEEILALNPVCYHYKKNNALQLPYERTFYGYIAQDVEKIIPEAVLHGEDGYLKMVGDPILLALVNAVKELSAENDELQTQLNKLLKR
jgi:hypothetical protein